MEKLKLEAGKYYRTRDGAKAYICGSTPDRLDFVDAIRDGYSLTGMVSGVRYVHVWEPDGSAVHEGNDLIAEWVEPKRIKGWLNIYGNLNHHILHDTREAADSSSYPARVACIEIDVLEGEGL